MMPPIQWARSCKLAALALLLLGSPARAAPKDDAAVILVANRLLALQLEQTPTAAYSLGAIPVDQSRWPDRSPESVAGFQRRESAMLAELRRISPGKLTSAARTLHGALVERLEANEQLRICRSELWAVNHMFGWHLDLGDIAKSQPVATERQREQALARWSSLGTVIDQEIGNARTGLDAGYSAPKSVVARVLRQLDGMLASSSEESPFYSPAARSPDAEFKTRFASLIGGEIATAISRYRKFLQEEYLPRAREALGVSANPDGAACYRASLRSYTTLDRPPEAVFKLGRRTVGANMATVVAMGRKRFGTSDPQAIAAAIAKAPDNKFSSEDELIAYSRAAVERARARSAALFPTLPEQEVRVEPFPVYQRGSGRSSHYEPGPSSGLPAYYRINSESWQTETRGGAEIAAYHETFPGHHMQVALSNSMVAPGMAGLTFNSAYIEGWARYAEMLAEEAGLYQVDHALMSRRLWPARGMVVDPGIHVLGWTREQATAFLRESGGFGEGKADVMLDRIAALPGQLTAYDSGGLEIMALRSEAKSVLGKRFDLRRFHAKVLESGPVPLSVLRSNITQWIAVEKRQRPRSAASRSRRSTPLGGAPDPTR
jgi:uncharacterized protein (DUF885 family)